MQAAAFVHTTEPFVEGRAETASSLCPHFGAFKKCRWAFEHGNGGRGQKQDSPQGAPVCFMQVQNGGG